MSEETTVVDTETSEDTTTTEEITESTTTTESTDTEDLWSIKEETLVALANQFRLIENDQSNLFTIDEMIKLVSWIPTEVNTQSELIDQIQAAINAKNSSRGENVAVASEIFNEKVAYDAAGNQITGTFTIDDELSNQAELLSSITTALEGKGT